ncbi:MAG: hypothetical protein FWE59_05745 [Oscillospiraceae bacterium]|nr:hypothetical protein [Oscillospiraceae bacterium]
MKKIIVAFFAVALSVAMVVAGSYAWYSADDEQPNEFTLGRFGVILNEVFDGWDQKEVSASNTGDIPALVRLTALPILVYTDGNGAQQRLNVEGRVELIRPVGFSDNWYDAGDGWFYYKFALAPSEETPLFLRRVVFDDYEGILSILPEDASDLRLEVDVIMEAVEIAKSSKSGHLYRFEDVWDVGSLDAGQTNVLRDLLRGICAAALA